MSLKDYKARMIKIWDEDECMDVNKTLCYIKWVNISGHHMDAVRISGYK